MRIILTGATGMVGQGVLRECLLDDSITEVLSVARSPLHQQHPKLRELLIPDLANLSGHESKLTGFDACFFCAGVSSAGMSEEKYTALTYDLTLSFAHTLASLNHQMTFVYVSGVGTDSTEKGRSMWARVKGRTENALLSLSFKAAFMFRPGFIQPLHGIRSKTRLYQLFYDLLTPVIPLLKGRLPKFLTTTEQLGRAMIHVAKSGYPKPILDPEDINRL
ncbi:NAD-dependent epimerase/dehydratase family protein [Edaphobacter aggregans]|uniref:NAD-dependent epimerase/dehydratase family protein n=1 Tax=Edaphobacter aggregans TaxID=570835 RepID=UPI00054FF24B|nr:NAD-dependent epimerase/dehydratase family protein [Edaphobacter aggregans]